VDAGQGLEHHRHQPMESGRRQPIGTASDVVGMGSGHNVGEEDWVSAKRVEVQWGENHPLCKVWMDAHRVREDFEP
jgi:hypothetical protein